MANRIKGITVEIGGDTTNLSKALNSVDKNIRNTQNQLKDVEKLLKLDPSNTQLLAQKQKLLAQNIENTKTKLDTLKKASESAAKTAGNYDAWKNKYAPIQAEITKTQENLKALKEKAADADEQLSNGEISQEKYDALQSEIKDTQNKLKELKKSAEDVNKEFGNPISSEQYDALQREIIETESDLKNLKKQAENSSDAVKEVGNKAKTTGDKVDESGDKFKESSGEINEMARQSDGLSDKLSALKVAMGNLVADGIEKVIESSKKFAVESIKSGMAFESQMSNVGAISQASAEDMEKLSQKAKEMGETTSFSATQSGQAFEYMAMAGWKTDEMIGGIAGVMDLAAASGEDLATTSDIVTDAMTAFGMAANESSHFSDVLAVASSNANTNVGMMGETFKYVAPVAGALNYSIEDTAQAIGLMANSGIKASQAGTSLRSIITRLSTNAGASKNKLGALDVMTQKLGVSFYNTDGSARDLNVVLSEAREAWAGLSEEQQTSYGKTIAGQEALSGWLAIMNAAPADIDKLTGAIENCDGAAKKMAETRLDNLEGDVTLFKSALEGAQIAITEEFSPFLREIVQKATKLMPNIKDKFVSTAKGLVNFIKDYVMPGIKGFADFWSKTLYPEVKNIAKYLGGKFKKIFENLRNIFKDNSGNLSFLADTVKTFYNIVKNGIKGIFEFVEWLTGASTGAKSLRAIIEGLVIVFGVYKGAMLALDIAQKAVAASSALINATNPFGWVPLAIGGITALTMAIGSLITSDKSLLIESRELTAEQEALRNETAKVVDEYKKWNEEKNNSLNGALKEAYANETLLKELDKVVDKNGKIKEGNEERAQSIIDNVNEALGLEIEVVDGVIDKYDELKKTIEEKIEIQKTDAIIESMGDSYIEALQKIEDARINYQKNLAQYNEIDDEFKQIDELVQWMNTATSEDIVKNLSAWGTDAERIMSAIDNEYQRVRKQRSDFWYQLKDSEEVYVDYNTTLSNVDAVRAAQHSGSVEEMKKANNDLLHNFQTAKTGTELTLRYQYNNAKNFYDNLVNLSKDSRNGITQDEIDAAKADMERKKGEWEQRIELDKQEYNKLGKESTQSYVAGINEKSGEAKTAVENMGADALSALSTLKYDFGLAGEDSGQSYAEGFKNKAKGLIDNFLNSTDYNSGKLNVADLVGSVQKGISIPKTATGGIFDSPTVRLIGEDGPEAVVPLEKNIGWIKNLAGELSKTLNNNRARSPEVTVIMENVKISSDYDIKNVGYQMGLEVRKAIISAGG